MISLDGYAVTDRPVSIALPADDARTLCLILTLADAGMPHRVHVADPDEDDFADTVRQARSLDPDAFDARPHGGVVTLGANLAVADMAAMWRATASDPQYDDVRAFAATQLNRPDEPAPAHDHGRAPRPTVLFGSGSIWLAAFALAGLAALADRGAWAARLCGIGMGALLVWLLSGLAFGVIMALSIRLDTLHERRTAR